MMNDEVKRFASRRKRLIRRFPAEGVEGLLVTTPDNVFYLSGMRGDDSALLVTPSETFFLTDSRYAEEAAETAPALKLIVRTRSMMWTAALQARRTGVGRLGVEACAMTLVQHDELTMRARKVGIRPLRGTVERLRLIKDASEVALIRRAMGIAEKAFKLTLEFVAPGKTEIEVAHHLERTMQDLGAEGPAFPTIVAAGERSSLPHAVPTDRRIKRGDAVLFDWGARYGMYCSDLTRMVFLDRISEFFKRIYSVVLSAQRRSLARIRPGRKTGNIDYVARSYLKAHRHGKHFGHGLGHGVGLHVHEGPVLRAMNEAALRPGMVVTVEPGIYIPGRGGVRIEDLVLVTRKGRSIITSLPKSLDAFLIET